MTTASVEIFLDCETDGLDPTVIWCVAANGVLYRAAHEFRRFLYQNRGATLYAHNGMAADYGWLEKLWDVDLSGFTLRDTMVLSRLANPSREGGHSLDNLSGVKGSHSDWTQYTEEMGKYCLQDEQALRVAYKRVMRELEGFSEQAVQLEHDVASIIHRQVKHGWLLDTMKASMLLAELKDKQYALEKEVQETFKPCAVAVREHEPKLTMAGQVSKVGLKSLGDDYVNVGGPLTLITWQDFNLGSRKQIGERLVKLGWKPTTFTPTGQPVVDEKALETVPDIPEAKLIAEFLTVQKRVALVASWLEVQDPDTGRVHGYVNSNGAVTGRMTHSNPNVTQVPASYSLYGPECRAAWTVLEGYKLVGVDADGLELRCLAHYMKDENYIKAVVEGNKDDGTDVHTNNQRAAGLATRDQAKTFIYAFLYGAGDEKIGSIVGRGSSEGRKLKERFLRATPSLKALKDAVGRAAQRGWLLGLDGRRIQVRSQHAALNSLLQGAGAVIMKQALINLDKAAKAAGLDYRFVGNIHDEIQVEVREDHAEAFAKLAENAIIDAGVMLNLRCPLAGGAQIGDNWNETH